MATINAGNVGSGPSSGFGTGTWNGIHDEDAGPTGFLAGLYNNASPIGSQIIGPVVWKGAFISWTTNNIRRFWIDFDLSGESGTATAVTLKCTLLGVGSATNRNMQTTKIIPIKTTKSAGVVVNTTFNDLDGWGAGFDDSDLTAFATEQVCANGSSASGVVSWTFNSDGIAAVNDAIGSGDFIVNMMEYDHDYLDSAVSTQYDYYGCNFVMTGDDEPILEITYGSADPPTIIRLKLDSGITSLKGGSFKIK